MFVCQSYLLSFAFMEVVILVLIKLKKIFKLSKLFRDDWYKFNSNVLGNFSIKGYFILGGGVLKLFLFIFFNRLKDVSPQRTILFTI